MKNRYSAVECFRNYRFHSIFWKNLLLICCVVLLPFLCALLISGYTYDELRRNETQSYSNELMTRVSMDINNLFDNARSNAVRIGFDQNVQGFANGRDNANSAREIAAYLQSYKVGEKELSSICIYRLQSGNVISTTGKTNYSYYRDKMSIDMWDPQGEMIQIRYLPADAKGGLEQRVAFYFRPGYAKAEQTCCIIIEYNLKELAKRLDYGEGMKLIVLNNEQVLYNSESSFWGIPVSDAQPLLEPDETDIAVSKELKLFGLRLFVHVDSRPLFEKLHNIRMTTVALMVVAVLATVLVVFYISRKIFDPISDLLALLEENQTPEESNLIQTTDEIGYIRHMMSATITKSKNIEEELSRRMKLLKKAQAVALQAQINPHFMYNTIDTINWMAIKKIGKGNEVSEMLNMLSQLLRYSLGNTDTVVPLREEINYTKKYLLVQQIRCNFGFDVLWDIPKELDDCNVIKMILQPVVENAIKYGIKPFGDGGVLQIRAVRAGETVRVFVSDSGFGMTQEEADEVNRVIRSQVIKESDHIGLSNVHQRINLMFGDQYGVSVRSKINEGTTVELTIPYLQ